MSDKKLKTYKWVAYNVSLDEIMLFLYILLRRAVISIKTFIGINKIRFTNNLSASFIRKCSKKLDKF